jgi:dTDP-3-amino-2,3,6-trideoxy-4-keto-D-glucose/dTDP-3-amino-3,4,6-trideoxy-alpha-D-glucose/dTDP-2,6-dideoxy-D-kanosamine transaminase
VVVTHSAELADKLRLYRNHGMKNRDEVAMFGPNSRLDSLQAVIGNRLIDEVGFITNRRIAIAERYDAALADLGDFIGVPTRRDAVKHVFHLYVVRAQRRDELLAYLNEKGVEAKIHYPIPMHLQEASAYLGYKKGDFPVSERDSESIITLPAHQHLTDDEVAYAIDAVRSFYLK